MSVLIYPEFQKFLDNNPRKDMSYKDYLFVYSGVGCYRPYKIYTTKKFLFFRKKVFLKTIPCGICANCLKNRQVIQFTENFNIPSVELSMDDLWFLSNSINNLG